MSQECQDRVTEIFNRLKEHIPDPKGELFFTTPYTLLVAVVLSAQATDQGVNRVTKTLFLEIDTPSKMCALGEEALREKISSIGLYRSKARHIIALSKKLLSDHAGHVPQNRAALEALPGVGRKTANVILNDLFQHPTIAVDTHVFRVSQRLGLSMGKTPLAVEHDLERVIPDRFKPKAHHWLILHGRSTCKAKKPTCSTCCVQDLCAFSEAEKKTPQP